MVPPRLSSKITPSGVRLPNYDRSQVQLGILHIGIGNFHKAHQAVYTEDVLELGDLRWGIQGVAIRSARAENQLIPQDGLYTAVTLSPEKVQTRIVGAIQDVVTTTTQSALKTFLNSMADPNIQVITITVTEKGYCSTATGLNLDHPDIHHDLTTNLLKRSLPGLLVEGLAFRAKSNSGPITLISCDNMIANGQLLAQVVREYAEHKAPDLLSWLESNVSFPSTMVDRISPATTKAEHERWREELGYRDDALVCAEPFGQWVIENDFAGSRPPWENAGAMFVDNVEPYEHAKLRLLNGPHSACAYIGLLAGNEFVHEVVADRELADFIRRLASDEIIPSVDAPPGFQLDNYFDEVLNRFANSAVLYRTQQVGTDGSQKLPQRLVPIIQQRLARNEPIDKLALVIAAWFEHLSDPAPDPMSSTLQSLHQLNKDPLSLVAAVFENTSVFDGLGDQQAPLVAAIAAALTKIRSKGLRKALR